MEHHRPTEPSLAGIRIHGNPRMLGGIWANFAIVGHSPHEFTLDFARLDYNIHPIEGVLVQRVNMSPLFVRQLIDALAANLADYARSAPDGIIMKED